MIPVGGSERSLCHYPRVGELRPETAHKAVSPSLEANIPSIFGGTGRPSKDESERRRQEFLRLLLDGVPGDEAAQRARITLERALRIATHPDVVQLLAAA